MSDFVLQYTDVGMQALIRAKGVGLQEIVSHMAVGSVHSNPSPSKTQLASEQDRVQIATVEDGGTHWLITARFDDPAKEYAVHEIGIFLQGGELLGTLSRQDPIAYKSAPNGVYNCQILMDLRPLPTGSVTVQITQQHGQLSQATAMATQCIAQTKLAKTSIRQAHQQWLFAEQLRTGA